ncbi:MAG: HAMP domain-containing histidine kinase [Saprospiraceae bacterium]|jgi:two-component system phosphate regulon sensor histidine kinase PhoR|nr:HAMP domain-containing histidine kinase [Saprospiraceae bacterium]MBK8888816.1 HAMP domain-containing histidine kinase [Saprospiraceae bacterium]MBK9584187.1 HAMP domain-containing histidine kinase [Saprospiraceae bacterium]MBP6540207.1 HAMP domain-containing histidine kinase [Saprospiraceae bacterium]MBP9055602.1 HAMP domain-containing histidine kinase [Saprospiraceae bacterium]
MPNNLIRRLIILGGLSIIGIIFVQSYWLLKTWDIKDKEFDQTVNIVLHNVAERMAKYNKTILPKSGLVQRKSSNYYAVNINSEIDAGLLEQYLSQEMIKQSLNIAFEYAVYHCATDELVYGNYCSPNNIDEKSIKKNKKLPKFKNLIYYFVVRFPERESFLLANRNMTLTLTILSILAIVFFLYSMWVIMEQKRLSELQKDFINNMTHEFKTPISSIKIASDFLANNDNVKEDSRLNRYIQIIREQNQRLNEQVEKVLNVARLEKDSIELKKEIFELNKTLEDIIKNESLKLKQGNISFKNSKEKININADKLHFVNVVANMIDNAIKYSNEKPIVELSVVDAGKDVLLGIKDHGIGIDKESQKKLFDKFYRVSTGNVHNVKGFGLGLFYVKNICKAHGWTLQLESEPGVGTEFIITIPKSLTA